MMVCLDEESLQRKIKDFGFEMIEREYIIKQTIEELKEIQSNINNFNPQHERMETPAFNVKAYSLDMMQHYNKIIEKITNKIN